jgi:hypothetical protein
MHVVKICFRLLVDAIELVLVADEVKLVLLVDKVELVPVADEVKLVLLIDEIEAK